MTTATTTVEDTGATDQGRMIHFTNALTVAIPNNGHVMHAVLGYGTELLLTDEIMEASRDRNGRSRLLERLEAGEGVHYGTWPEGKVRFEPGSLDFAEAREAARQAIWKIEDEAERRAAQAAHRATYGSLPTSKTLATIKGDPGA